MVSSVLRSRPRARHRQSYAEFETETLQGILDGVPVRVCGLDHLRAMKQAADRPQDLEDLKRLGTS
jgi:hypothetical protein